MSENHNNRGTDLTAVRNFGVNVHLFENGIQQEEETLIGGDALEGQVFLAPAEQSVDGETTLVTLVVATNDIAQSEYTLSANDAWSVLESYGSQTQSLMDQLAEISPAPVENTNESHFGDVSVDPSSRIEALRESPSQNAVQFEGPFSNYQADSVSRPFAEEIAAQEQADQAAENPVVERPALNTDGVQVAPRTIQDILNEPPSKPGPVFVDKNIILEEEAPQGIPVEPEFNPLDHSGNTNAGGAGDQNPDLVKKGFNPSVSEVSEPKINMTAYRTQSPAALADEGQDISTVDVRERDGTLCQNWDLTCKADEFTITSGDPIFTHAQVHLSLTDPQEIASAVGQVVVQQGADLDAVKNNPADLFDTQNNPDVKPNQGITLG